MEKNTFSTKSLYLVIFIIIALLVNLFILFMPIGSEKENSSDIDSLAITFLTTPDCETCFSLDPFEEYFTSNGVDTDSIEKKEADSFTAKRLISKLKITSVPTVVVEGPIESFPFMQELIDATGEVRDDYFVVTKLQPPYIDLESDSVVGEFDVIYLDDPTCEECYDVTLHEQVLDRLALQPVNINTVDVNSEEGQSLVDTYYISTVPTILFQGDLALYEQLNTIWETVGSIEDDGTYVLRSGVEQMGPYKVIPSGEIIIPEPLGADPIEAE